MAILRSRVLKSLFLLMIPAMSFGQEKYMFSNRIFNLQFLYNYHVPTGVLADRYGNFSTVGFGAYFKTKTNWALSVEGNYGFGGEIKEYSLMNNLATSGGYISSVGGSPGNYTVAMRTFSTYLTAGRLFGLSKRNMNSGILVQGGAGYLQHKILIQVPERNIPQLDEEYVKGYDRLSSGLALREFIGYAYQSHSRMVNFYIGIEWMQGFTQNRRGYNYDEMAPDTKSRIDLSTSVRVGWLIPIYMNTKEENEFQFQ